MAIYGPPFPNYRGGPLQRGRLKGCDVAALQQVFGVEFCVASFLDVIVAVVVIMVFLAMILVPFFMVTVLIFAFQFSARIENGQMTELSPFC
jgi:hypothetical protein